MGAVGIERRRFRRAELDVPVRMRTLQEGKAQTEITGQVKNVSLAGVYCTIKSPSPFQPGEEVICSVSVPPEHGRAFPFASLFGKGWVVRTEPIPSGRRAGESQAEDRIAMAVAFAPDITALGVIES